MDTETVRVKWEVDVEVDKRMSPREIAQHVAETYFQERIFRGEPEMACVFEVGGSDVDLSDPEDACADLAQAATRALRDLSERIPGVEEIASVKALQRLIDRAGETR